MKRTDETQQIVKVGEAIEVPSWGRIRQMRWDELTSNGDGTEYAKRCGIVREVDRDVVYRLDETITNLSAVEGEIIPVWVAVASAPRNVDMGGARRRRARRAGGGPAREGNGESRVKLFEMDLRTDVAPIPENGCSTLHDLATKLWQRKKFEQDDPDLIALDWMLDRFLGAVAMLHGQGLSAAFFDPRTIIRYRSVTGESLALPDVGFRWAAPAPFPRWLDDGAEFEELWYPASLAKMNEGEFDARAELVAVARMLVWVMTGEIPASIPKLEATDAESQRFWAEKRDVEIWRVLYRVLGQLDEEYTDVHPISSVAELLTEVRQYPVSEHFRKRRRRRRRRPPFPWLSVLSFVLVACILGSVYHFQEEIGEFLSGIKPPQPPPRSYLCSECSPESSLYPFLRGDDRDAKRGLEHVVEDLEKLQEKIRTADKKKKLKESSVIGVATTGENLERQMKNLEEHLEFLGRLKAAGLSSQAEDRRREEECLELRDKAFRGLLDDQYIIVTSSLHKGVVVPADQVLILKRLDKLFTNYAALPHTAKPEEPNWLARVRKQIADFSPSTKDD